MAPRNSISFDEIRDGNHFEDLVAAYFECLEDTQVSPPAVGADDCVQFPDLVCVYS